MDQLTVRGIDADLERRLRDVARERGVSLSKAAILLLRRGAGLDDVSGPEGAIGHALDGFFGGWSADEAGAFLDAVADFENSGAVDGLVWVRPGASPTS